MAEVFNKEVNQGQAPDIPGPGEIGAPGATTQVSPAGMGISGANIAVAETGSLVIITNEGNARLVTTLPKIHVAIVGIEKLMASSPISCPS